MLLSSHQRCLGELANLHTWWESLSVVEKRMPSNKAALATTEANSGGEISAFVKAASNGGIEPTEAEDYKTPRRPTR